MTDFFRKETKEHVFCSFGHCLQKDSKREIQIQIISNTMHVKPSVEVATGYQVHVLYFAKHCPPTQAFLIRDAS